jgi:CRISPR system Cascade subunit CasD
LNYQSEPSPSFAKPSPLMSAKACLALLLDAPMQSWGFASRFTRLTTALHPTRSGIFGMIAAAMGIDKHGETEPALLARFGTLRVTVVSLPRQDYRGRDRLIQRLDDYHTVTGIRTADGQVQEKRTVLSNRHYLLDARFGVLLAGDSSLLSEFHAALENPRWGIWFGRKCCLPASPVLASTVGDYADVWRTLLKRSGYPEDGAIEHFDHVIEVAEDEPGAEPMEDVPIGFGLPIGERHAPRWIRRIPKRR